MDVMQRDAASRQIAEEAQASAAKGQARIKEMEAALQEKLAEVDRVRKRIEREAETEVSRLKAEQRKRFVCICACVCSCVAERKAERRRQRRREKI